MHLDNEFVEDLVVPLAECFNFDPPLDGPMQELFDEDANRRQRRLV